MTVSGRFGEGTFGEFVFGAGTTFDVTVTIDSVTTTGQDIDVVYSVAVTIDGVTTTTQILSQEILLETQIDAVTTTSFNIGTLQLLDILISACSYIGTLQSRSPFFNRSYFNRMGFGADPEVYSLDLDITRGLDIVIDALTTVEDFLIINPAWLEMEVNTVSGTTPFLHIIHDLVSQVDGVTGVTATITKDNALRTEIDAVTMVTNTPHTIAGLEVTIDTVSGTTFTILFTYGYPLKVSLTTSKRGSGISATKRHSHLSVDR